MRGFGFLVEGGWPFGFFFKKERKRLARGELREHFGGLKDKEAKSGQKTHNKGLGPSKERKKESLVPCLGKE